MNTAKLSIVTVCFNAEKTIRKTIESIINQTFTDYEYIIVDGASTDNTYNIVCEYDNKFKNKNIKYIHISEKDTGIYNAMNKGTDLASGQYINFMNADDKFSSPIVLENIFNKKDCNADLIYGDVNHITQNEKQFVQAGKIENIVRAMVFSHQSTFIKTSIQKEYRFNENYRISADYDMLLRCYLDKKTFLHVPVTVADFSLDGFCNSNKYKTYLETLNIQEANGIINQKSFAIRGRKIFHYFRLKFESNKVAAKIFEYLISKFGRG